MRWILALALALVVGTGSLYGLTDGFTVVTAESARRRDVARQPRAIHDAHVVNEQGDVSSLRRELQTDGRVAIVNYFYTRCISLCLAQGFVTQRLQRAIEADGLQSRVRLISISFDPRDRGPDLNRYASSMRADPGLWRFWAFTQAGQRDALLRQFGIIVVPARFGDFEHNAALHVVTPDGKLAGIVDLDAPGLALRLAKALSTDHAVPASHAAGRQGRAAGVHGWAHAGQLERKGAP